MQARLRASQIEVWERVPSPLSEASGNESGNKWRPIGSLKTSLTGKTVDLDDVSLIPVLVDAWGSLRYNWFVLFLLHMAGN